MKSVVKNLVLHAIYFKIIPIVRVYNVPSFSRSSAKFRVP